VRCGILIAVVYQAGVMVKKNLIVKNRYGLHARVALDIANKCSSFESGIVLCHGCAKANACSIIEMLCLGASEGSELEIVATGNDEVEALSAIADIFEGGAGI
jgi:phosphotransferase system HPr (HPr) family protein